MKSRTERYIDSSDSVRTRVTRTRRNEHLYDDMNQKIGLEVINFDTQAGIDLSSLLSNDEEKGVELAKKRIEVADVIQVESPKVFDVNSILEEAKRNRTEVDELEKKRKLKNEEYNVLSNLNKKYIMQKDKLNKELEDEGLQELIDTITSSTLTSDIKNQELFGDLMPTSTNIELENTKTGEMEKINKTEDGHLVNSFYTRSMDLSEQDFEMSEEFVEDIKKKKVVLIIIVILILLLLVGVVSYFLLKYKNII